MHRIKIVIMKFTKTYLKELYKRCNHQFFNDELPKTGLSFRIDHSIHNLAGCYFSTKNDKINTTIYFSDMYEWNEQYLEIIMLHEMVHISLYCTNKKADSKHGKSFKNACTEFYNKFNISIPIDGSFVPLNEQGLKTKNAIKKTNNIFLIALNYIVNKFF